MTGAQKQHALREIIAVELRLLDTRRQWGGAKRISDCASAVNNSGYGTALGSIQRNFESLAIIQTAALFETNQRNPVHSIPNLLKSLETFPMVGEARFVSYYSSELDMQAQPPRSAFFDFAKRYAGAPLSSALDEVRKRRDQRLVHFDKTPKAEVLEYDHVDSLLEHCRLTLRMAAVAFGDSAVRPNEELIAHLSLDRRGDIARLVAALTRYEKGGSTEPPFIHTPD